MSQVREGKMYLPTSVETTSEERTVAALAHASSLLTLLVGIATVGLGGVVFAFIPFLIYLSYKDRSKFVANQAAQAFALQVLGTVGLFVGVVGGSLLVIVLFALATLLTVILIGLILYPVAALVMLAVITVLLGAPFVFMAFSVVSTVEALNGRNYQYPYIGPWVEDWLKRQETGATPAV